ncbi:PREDICTED: protein lethal(2)essential for life-like [Polistes dominula]|uniref:Protein lethal(2)essential for life-like n=1 Tax=Polistes dominula TaxID=743375 RepID=A0ABM1JC56_POLDO|nr:PREDICTED: protein lethal(2)essential for life-like [Polistes dominula]
MILLPLLFSSLLTDIDQSQKLIDNNLENDLFPEINSLYPFSPFANALLNGPWFEFLNQDKHTSSVTTDEHNFKIVLDVKEFKPNEIKVKVADGYIIVEGQHEEKKDKDGFVSRQFVRRYLLPYQAETDKITSKISTDRILTIIAPLNKNLEKPTEKTIKIELSDKPAVTQKDNDKKVTVNSNHEEGTTPKDTIHVSNTAAKSTIHVSSTTPKSTTHALGTTPKDTIHSSSTTSKDTIHSSNTTSKQ